MLRAQNRKPVCIDLCCGAGGLAYAFELAGFDVALGVDIDKQALLTHKRNRPQTTLVEIDIQGLDKETIKGFLPKNKRNIEGLLASPPCKGFSQSNRRSRTLENPLNLLYLQIMRIIKELQPKWFLIENVWGLQQVADGYVKDHIIGLGNSLGYQVVAEVLNAADFGVPQSRRRIFFVGTKHNGHFVFPMPNTFPYLSVKEAISDLPLLKNGENRCVLPYRLWGNCLTKYQTRMRGTNRKAFVSGNLVTRNNDLVLKRYKHIPPGGNWKNIPPHLMRNYRDRTNCHTGIYRRLRWDTPSVVISNFRKNMLIHPEQDRGLSLREAARLQSFPDSFIFEGCIGSQQQQVADAVPPLLAYELAKAIKTYVYCS